MDSVINPHDGFFLTQSVNGAAIDVFCELSLGGERILEPVLVHTYRQNDLEQVGAARRLIAALQAVCLYLNAFGTPVELEQAVAKILEVARSNELRLPADWRVFDYSYELVAGYFLANEKTGMALRVVPDELVEQLTIEQALNDIGSGYEDYYGA